MKDGNLNEDWKHIDSRHVTGDNPKGQVIYLLQVLLVNN